MDEIHENMDVCCGRVYVVLGRVCVVLCRSDELILFSILVVVLIDNGGRM